MGHVGLLYRRPVYALWCFLYCQRMEEMVGQKITTDLLHEYIGQVSDSKLFITDHVDTLARRQSCRATRCRNARVSCSSSRANGIISSITLILAQPWTSLAVLILALRKEQGS